MKECLDLYRTFFLIGSITFGGGYAILPILIREIVEKRKWITEDAMLDYFAVSQCTPGIICVNISTFMGYRRKGFWGALSATLGVITPSMIIITVIAAVLTNFTDIIWVQHAFAGIRIAVSALIASTVWNLAAKNARTWLKAAIAVSAFVTVALLSISPIYVTIAFAVFGAFFFGRRRQAS
ncbi:MAG TPA: chromate transporter [Candidatus Limiplasma sp.]|nr:chromate transporter [Candidatus Limiplasma sp.]